MLGITTLIFLGSKYLYDYCVANQIGRAKKPVIVIK